jgi:hypothetical protein
VLLRAARQRALARTYSPAIMRTFAAALPYGSDHRCRFGEDSHCQTVHGSANSSSLSCRLSSTSRRAPLPCCTLPELIEILACELKQRNGEAHQHLDRGLHARVAAVDEPEGKRVSLRKNRVGDHP